ncbi:DUF2971 domain-containing protein [uncultured Enterobacter sp.]|uniref:DUF2971 domain-containing protein n=1 Tax=uncultured Enterobacter sp. TaxID=238202 RepID=UPI00258B531F|nr:DUF2971 domain-containing protein [uncultured Enterobacter sp.]
MSDEKIPQFLFKYTTFNSAIKAIQHKTLYWSSVKDFNDPFEYKFRFYTNGNEAAVISRFLSTCLVNDPSSVELLYDNLKIKNLIYAFLKEPSRNKFDALDKEVSNCLHDNKYINESGESVKAIKLFKAIFFDHVQDNMKNILNDQTGVLCLTDNTDNNPSRLMWSHYAENHNGVMMKLNTDNIINISSDKMSRIRKVTYSADYPLIEYDDYLGFAGQFFDKNVKDLVIKMIFTKSEEWRYENEYRCIIPYKDGPRALTVKDSTFDSFYLGLNMANDKRQTIINEIKTNLPNAKIYETTQKNNKYKLEFNEIS